MIIAVVLTVLSNTFALGTLESETFADRHFYLWSECHKALVSCPMNPSDTYFCRTGFLKRLLTHQNTLEVSTGQGARTIRHMMYFCEMLFEWSWQLMMGSLFVLSVSKGLVAFVL